MRYSFRRLNISIMLVMKFRLFLLEIESDLVTLILPCYELRENEKYGAKIDFVRSGQNCSLQSNAFSGFRYISKAVDEDGMHDCIIAERYIIEDIKSKLCFYYKNIFHNFFRYKLKLYFKNYILYHYMPNSACSLF